MSVVDHWRYGYLIQLTSLLTLGLTNILLPNLLGPVLFLRLNEAYAIVAISAMVYNEGIASLIIRRISETRSNKRDARDLAIQGAVEHVCISMASLLVVITASVACYPNGKFSVADCGVFALVDIIIACYVCLAAAHTAMLDNRTVVLLGLAQGGGSVVMPIAFAEIGWDLRFAIAGSFGVPLVLLIFKAAQLGTIRSPPSLSVGRRICLTPALIAAIVQAVVRISLIWIPVLALGARVDPAGSGSYKIGMSLAFGVLALVPFHKQTAMSIDRDDDWYRRDQRACFAVVLAAVGALILGGLGSAVFNTLLRREFSVATTSLRAFGVFVVLQILSDILFVRLLMGGATRSLALGACGAVAGVFLSQAALPIHWVPVSAVACYLGVVLLHGGWPSKMSLALRSAGWGLVSTITSAMWPNFAGLGTAIAVLGGACWLDRSIRTALRELLSELLTASVARPVVLGGGRVR